MYYDYYYYLRGYATPYIMQTIVVRQHCCTSPDHFRTLHSIRFDPIPIHSSASLPTVSLLLNFRPFARFCFAHILSIVASHLMRFHSYYAYIHTVFVCLLFIVNFLVVPFYVMLLITILVHYNYDMMETSKVIHYFHHIQSIENQLIALIGYSQEHQL
jgi:hypothetical protein